VSLRLAPLRPDVNDSGPPLRYHSIRLRVGLPARPRRSDMRTRTPSRSRADP
jgi:hypothetical protein